MLRMKKRAIRRFALALPGWLQRPQVWLAHRVHNLTRTQRIVCASIAGVLVLSATVPTVLTILKNQSYQLSDAILRVVGTPNQNLANKITYNAQKDSWQFNQSDIPIGSGTGNSTTQQADMPSVADLKSQIGGGGQKDESLYAVNMPTSGSQGVTYYDTNTDLSFSLVPEFSVGEGRTSKQGHVVYPLDQGAKLIYSAKTNGLKEDIVLTKPIGDTAEFSYKLELPETLEAKIQADGSLGVFSPDPVLFGNISFGGDQDKEKILSARQTAAKDHLLFVIPAPVIIEATGKKAQAPAHFELANNTLAVKASKLNNLQYPLSIDPSVVVTSSSDFGSGSGDNIAYGTDQISRAPVTGGDLNTWATTNPHNTTVYGIGSVIANGYMYVSGGANGSTISTDVSYAPVNTNGTVGTWTSTSALNTQRSNHGFVAYNGYLYAIGGASTAGGSLLASVEYAQINSDGTVGTWQTTTALPSARGALSAVAINGYVYALAGLVSGSVVDTVLYAPILANGTIGSWNSTSSFTTARRSGGAFAYNDKLYILGGSNGSGTYYDDAQYAVMNSDGTLGSWTATTSFTTARHDAFIGAMGGYAYVIGGTSNGTNAITTAQRAMINADGTLGGWLATLAPGTPRFGGGTALYKNYAYVVGGINSGSGSTRLVQYAAVQPAGRNTDYTLTNSFVTKRRGAATVAYNNFVYVMGGDNQGAVVSTVRQAPINDNGTLGTYTTGRALPAAMTFASAVAYRGYMYLLGGCTTILSTCTTTTNNTATVYRSAIGSDGSLGVWSTDTAFTTERYGHSVVAYGGYLYLIGGLNGSTFQSDIQYHAIGASGAISGAWSTSAYTLSTARAYAGVSTDGGRLYVTGGCSAGATTCTSTLSDILYGTFSSTGDLTGSLTTNSTSLPTSRGMHGFVINDGYAYAVGGWAGSTTFYGDTQYAPLNSDGSIGSWTAGSGFLETDETGAAMGVFVNAGYLFVTGGFMIPTVSAVFSDFSQSARLNNGGPGTVGATWTLKTGPGSSLTAYGAAVYNGYLYVVGGTDSGGRTANVHYAPINTDGTIGTWATTASLSTARDSAAIYAVDGYMYAVGGSNGSHLTSTEYAQINSNGTLGSWNTATAALSSGRSAAAYADYNGYVYYVGGTNGTPLTDVYLANPASNGDISSWSSTTALSTGLRDASAVAYNGYLYVLGGTDTSADTGKVLYAAINSSNGTLGSWNQASWIPGSGTTSAVAANGYMYVLGTAAGRTSTYRASIRADGSLGSFEIMRSMSNATTITIPRAVYNKGKVYSFGADGAVQLSGVNSAARIGRYSKLINLNGGYSLSSLTYGGTLNNGGDSNLLYASASSNGLLGSRQLASSLTGGGGGCGDAGTMYVQLFATLDDTFNAVFPDSNSSSVTDFTLSYESSRAPTEKRLSHGKFFSGETLQGLDTCGS